MNELNLKPCPFCGSSDIQVDRVGTHRASCQVSCMNCGASLESNEIGFGRSWNMRAPISAPSTLENTIETASAFMREQLKDRGLIAQETINNEYIMWLVAYAASIRPSVTLPDAEWVERFDLPEYSGAIQTIRMLKELNPEFNFIQNDKYEKFDYAGEWADE